MIKLSQILKQSSIPKYLYHATYKPLLNKIKVMGLDTRKSKTAWEDSVRGYVYLANDVDVAASYAESSEEVPEDWLEQIIILTIDTEKLDLDKLFDDSNVRNESSDTFEYRGVISPDAIVKVQKH
jgi:hypothetical protein